MKKRSFDAPWMAPRDFGAPGRAGRDAFVVPEIDAFVVQPCQVSIDAIGVLVRVAHKHIGLASAIRCERLAHSSYTPNKKNKDDCTVVLVLYIRLFLVAIPDELYREGQRAAVDARILPAGVLRS